MATVTVYSAQKKKVGDAVIAERIAMARPNRGLLFDAVQAVQTNRRQGTVSTKTRGEIRGGGRKPYRQKGTGNARLGSTRSPLCVGGGQIFGPRPRPWSHGLPKQQRILALAHALADRLQEDKLIVLDSWACGEKPHTKAFAKALSELGVTNAMLVLDAPNEIITKSARNLPGIGIVEARCLNAEHIMRHEHVVMTTGALEHLNARVTA